MAKYLNRIIHAGLYTGLIFLLLGAVISCASKPAQIRHLSYEIGVLTPESGAEEVWQVMGPPDLRRPAPDGGEEWLYLETRRSLMRRIWLVGGWLGREDHHLAVITIRDNRLVNAVYRALSAEEYKELNIKPRPDNG